MGWPPAFLTYLDGVADMVSAARQAWVDRRLTFVSRVPLDTSLQLPINGRSELFSVGSGEVLTVSAKLPLPPGPASSPARPVARE